MLEKTLESPLNCKEIKPVNPRGNQPWIFIGRTDAETEAPVLWLPAVKSWPVVKDPGAGKDWGQEKRATEDEMVRWHHRLNGHEFEQTPGDSEGQGSLACRSYHYNTCPWELVQPHWYKFTSSSDRRLRNITLLEALSRKQEFSKWAFAAVETSSPFTWISTMICKWRASEKNMQFEAGKVLSG